MTQPEQDLFGREDWTLFRTLDGLALMAGLPSSQLRRVVVKELVDNALDAAPDGDVEVQFTQDGDIRVTDNGPGIPGAAEQVAGLFSIRRPLRSSKLIRLPTLGALGNGLRVVAGAVLCSSGTIEVWTGGRYLRLQPQDDGETTIRACGPDETAGTTISVKLGSSIPEDPSLWAWRRELLQLAQGGRRYSGKTSAYWYDADSFFEFVQAAGERPVRDVVREFDGMASTSRTRAVLADTGLTSRGANSLSRPEAHALLGAVREVTQSVPVNRLDCVGRLPLFDGYVKAEGELVLPASRGGLDAALPFRVESWARSDPDGAITGDRFTVCVNRSPILAPTNIARQRDRGIVGLFGGGLRHAARVGQKPLELLVNVTTPFMPIRSSGKEPDLARFADQIISAVQQAARRARRVGLVSAEKPASQKDAFVETLPATIVATQGANTARRFEQRMLFYAQRDLMKALTGREVDFNYYTSLVTDYEAEYGPISGLIRDDRGVIYTPHRREYLPLGTLSVEQYQRPEWQFNKVLYIEKMGFLAILQDAGWPEAYDCLILTSKGFASRAARDLLDFMGETGEPVTFYCVHDADAYGTMIFQSLVEETRARPGRKVEVVNLGLEPAEAIALNLPLETVDRGRGRKPVADYVPNEWADWLQDHRCELNAMNPERFIAWLTAKMDEHGGNEKVIPPGPVIERTAWRTASAFIREAETARILRDAGIDVIVSDRDASLVTTSRESHVSASMPASRVVKP